MTNGPVNHLFRRAQALVRELFAQGRGIFWFFVRLSVGQLRGKWVFGSYQTGWPGEVGARKLQSFFETTIPIADIWLPGGTRERGRVLLEESVQWMEFRNLERAWSDLDPEYREFVASVGMTATSLEAPRSRSKLLLNEAQAGRLDFKVAVRLGPEGKFLLEDGGHRLVAAVLAHNWTEVRAAVVI